MSVNVREINEMQAVEIYVRGLIKRDISCARK